MLEGIVRESIGHKAAKALKRDGYLIANIYGKGLENVASKKCAKKQGLSLMSKWAAKPTA